MMQPATMMRLFAEVVFIGLGLLMVWVAISGRFFWDRRSPIWIGLGAVLIYWGARAWVRAGRYATRWHHLVRGGSLVLLGVVMLAIAIFPLAWAGPLLALAGSVVALRGLMSAVLVTRNP